MAEDQPRTLYVGNLCPTVSEELLFALFGSFGEIRGCKIIHEPGNDPYAFIEFGDMASAGAALAAMNRRNCLGREMKVNWASTSGGHQVKIDLSKHFHIFVGDLSPDIDQQKLREAFEPYGEISDVKIMKDPITLAHKGYGFVSFVNKVDAEAAISKMNGQWLGSRKIRTNWAIRKAQPGGVTESYSAGITPTPKYAHKLDYNEVWARASDTNSTVYCGGINSLTEDLIRNVFGVYGQITGIHAFPDRSYAFVRFANKEAACNAICGIHGMEINGGTAKCSWGKENIDMTRSTTPTPLVPSISPSLYANPAMTANQAAASTQMGAANPWGSAAMPTTGWPANYQWAGYPQNAAYWQGYAGYQNPMMAQGWGVAQAAAAAAGQPYQIGQYQQVTNGKS